MEDLLEHPLQVLDDGVLEVLILPRLEDVELFLDGAGNLLEVLLRHVQLPLCLGYLGPGPKTVFFNEIEGQKQDCCQQWCGSGSESGSVGSICFWASRIQIRIH
jgi:hypothetical protein